MRNYIHRRHSIFLNKERNIQKISTKTALEIKIMTRKIKKLNEKFKK